MKYELQHLATGKVAELNALSGALGPDALDISHLIRDLGVFTYDPGFMATATRKQDHLHRRRCGGEVGQQNRLCS
jgi:hypothetical protein